MKKILSILIITVLSLITFNANAQVVLIEKSQTVMKDSYHRYTITPGSSESNIQWILPATGTDGNVYSDNAGTILTIDSKTVEIYLKWTADVSSTIYPVFVREMTTVGCYDDRVNAIRINVTIEENNFKGNLTWTGHTTDVNTTTDCAVIDENGKTILTFNLFVAGFKVAAKCTYTYQVGLSATAVETDASWSDSITGDFDPTDLTIPVSEVIPRGDGLYYVWVKVTKLVDGFNTPVNEAKSTLVSMATLKQLPAPVSIELD